MIQLFIFNEISRAAIYGVGTYIQQIKNCLDSDYQLNIVNYYSSVTEFTIEEQTHVRIFDIPRNQSNLDENKCDEKYYINSVYLLAEFIDDSIPLIFHFNHFRYESVFTLLKHYWPKCRIILSVHYFNWCFPLNGNTEYFKQIIHSNFKEDMSLIEKEVWTTYKKDTSFLQSVDQIICLCQYAKNLLHSEYHVPESKLSLIFNGLQDERAILSDGDKEKLKLQLHLTGNDKIFLFVGRLDKIKGIKEIIQAFRSLVKKRNDCHLIIIGDGDYSSCLNESMFDWGSILFTGKLTKKEIYPFYAIADVGIMLSKHEQCSYTAIEMLMHGLPIIASDTTGLDEMVINNINGYKVKSISNQENVSFDIQRCSEIMSLSVSLNSPDCELLKKRCRQTYENHYSLELMKGRINMLYKDIVKL